VPIHVGCSECLLHSFRILPHLCTVYSINKSSLIYNSEVLVHAEHEKNTMLKKNSMVCVLERTIPTERPPLVGEVSANFCGERVPHGQDDGALRPYSRFSRQEPLLFYQVAPQLSSTRLSGPRSRPTTFFFLVVPGIESRPPDL
jgi:hypothetical protein